MKARFCFKCRKYMEAKGRLQDKCPSCGWLATTIIEELPEAFSAMPEFVDGPRTPDDDVLDKLLYE